MSPASELLLLDTSVVVHLARADATGTAMDDAYAIRARADRPLISIVSVGELLSMAHKKAWGERKRERLRELIKELVVVDLQRQPILDRYAEIDAYLTKKGFTLSNNDTWIAATAAAAGALLLTNDKDFDPLDGKYLQRIYFDPKLAPPP